MFNFAEFIKNNLVSGLQQRCFCNRASEYLCHELFNERADTQADFDEIQAVLYPPEPEKFMTHKVYNTK